MVKSRAFICKIVAFVLITGASTSCMYKMPSEDEFSAIPSTNNPAITRDKKSGMMPSIAL